MVAVGGQVAAVELREKSLLGIDCLEVRIPTHPGIAHLTVQCGVVIADHVDIEQIPDLTQRHHGMLREVCGAAQVGILTGKCHEIHIVLRLVPGIMRRQCDYRCGTGSIVVGSGIIHPPAKIAEMVVMRSENIATVMLLPLHLGDDVEQAMVFQKLVFDIHLHALNAFNGLGSDPDDGFVHHLLAICLVELDGRCPGIQQTGIRALSRLLQA